MEHNKRLEWSSEDSAVAEKCFVDAMVENRSALIPQESKSGDHSE
jgi:hypothetical protein